MFYFSRGRRKPLWLLLGGGQHGIDRNGSLSIEGCRPPALKRCSSNKEKNIPSNCWKCRRFKQIGALSGLPVGKPGSTLCHGCYFVTAPDVLRMLCMCTHCHVCVTCITSMKEVLLPPPPHPHPSFVDIPPQWAAGCSAETVDRIDLCWWCNICAGWADCSDRRQPDMMHSSLLSHIYRATVEAPAFSLFCRFQPLSEKLSGFCRQARASAAYLSADPGTVLVLLCVFVNRCGHVTRSESWGRWRGSRVAGRTG